NGVVVVARATVRMALEVFFFQAEDGIRDDLVTGVQTCALPICTPAPLDVGEPVRLAEAVRQMALQHVVITSVDRDDLPNGGAEVFAACITEIRRRTPGTSVEVLIPDFKGSEQALRLVVDAQPDILNHNLETIARL